MLTYQLCFLTLLSVLCLILCLPGLSCTSSSSLCLPAFAFQFKKEDTIPSLLLQHAISMVSFITMDFSSEPVSPLPAEHNAASHRLLLNNYGYGLEEEETHFYNARGLDIILVSMHVFGIQLGKIVASPQPLSDAFVILYDAAIDFASEQRTIQPALTIRRISLMCQILTSATLVVLLLLTIYLLALLILLKMSRRRVVTAYLAVATTLAALAFVTSLACGLLLFTLVLSLQRVAAKYATVTIGCGSIYSLISTACIGITAVVAGCVTVQLHAGEG